MSLLVIASEAHSDHETVAMDDGALVPSPENPQRAVMIEAALRHAGHHFAEPVEVDAGLLAAVHTPEYLEFLATAWGRWVERGETAPAAMGFAWPPRGSPGTRPDDLIGQLGFHSFSADTSIVAGTWTAALSSASVAVAATDRALDNGATVYGLCRPPGHHASADQFGGYCYLNNAALSAQRLLERGVQRVGILDIDYHHGNGTQSIFYDRSDVMVVSIHVDPRNEFPWFTGHANEVGEGRGHGWNLNLPLSAGADFGTWSSALEQALGCLEGGDIDALVVSLGVDTFEGDPMGTFRLTTPDFAAIGRRLATIGSPTVVLQEGGYAIADLGVNVAAFLEPLGQ